VAALLTFYSGFGLGTILSPVMMLFFPVDTAIALTGIVHLLSNLIKLLLMAKYADRSIVLHFSITALLSAMLGAWLLTLLGQQKPLFTYSVGDNIHHVLLIKIVIGCTLLFFAWLETLPESKQPTLHKNNYWLGGILSDFFGGISGNQGALRSAFLVHASLSKEAYIGTSVVLATIIDLAGIGAYRKAQLLQTASRNKALIIAATLSAVLGMMLGKQFIKKITMMHVQRLVAIMLVVIPVGLMIGIL
jgi:Domain of unknown function DUF81.